MVINCAPVAWHITEQVPRQPRLHSRKLKSDTIATFLHLEFSPSASMAKMLITLTNSHNLLIKHTTHLIHLDSKLSTAEFQEQHSVMGDPQWRSSRSTWLGLNIKAWLDQPLLIKKSLMILGISFVWLACYIHNDCCDKKRKKRLQMSSLSHQAFYFGLGSFEIGPKFFPSKSNYFSKEAMLSLKQKQKNLYIVFREKQTDYWDWGHIPGSNTRKSSCVFPTEHQTSVCVLNLVIIQSDTDREAQLGCSCGRSFLLSDTFMQRGGYYYHCANTEIHAQFKQAIMWEVREAMSCFPQAADEVIDDLFS